MQRNNRHIEITLMQFFFLCIFVSVKSQNLPINSAVINSGQHIFYSPDSITSPDTNCQQVLITGNANVEYKAAHTIHLKGEFRTDLSAGCGTFHAHTGAQPSNCPTPIITGFHYYCGNGIPNLSAATSLSGGGTILSYQWALNGHAIPGATNITHLTTVTGNYSVIVTNSLHCTVISPEHYVTVNGSSALFESGQKIYNVTIAGNSTNPFYANANGCLNVAPGPGSILHRYANFTTLGSLASVAQGAIIPFTIAENECDGAPYYPFSTAIYIDYNQNGFYFDAGEQVFISQTPMASPQNVTNSFAVPFSALTGQTTMRVLVYDASSSIGPCGGFAYGETEDYLITIVTPPPCGGAPNPGNTLASTSSACANASVNLSLQNLPTSNGVTYQWYRDTVLIPGETNATYVYLMQGSGTYRCAVTCTNSGLTTHSNPITVQLKSYIDCYCGAASIFPQDEKIYNVTVNGASTNPLYANANGCTTIAPGSGSVLGQYANFKTLGSLTTMAQGSTIPFSIYENECDGAIYYPNGIGVWIDFNQNASFNDSGEYVYSELNPIIGPRTVSGTFTVPLSALNGQTVMRVIVKDGYAGTGISPCGNYSNGETEDYLITIGTVPTVTTLNVKLFIQGYMIDSNTMVPVLANQGELTTANACDSIDVELRDNISPYGVEASTRTVLNQDGTAICNFPSLNGNYYIVVKHRNSIQTWSANTLNFDPNLPVVYDFTMSSTQTYGANQVEVYPNVWAIYSGDLFKDIGESIDLYDFAQLEVGINNFIFGYDAADINGDGNVDLNDVPFIEQNSNNFIFSNHP